MKLSIRRLLPAVAGLIFATAPTQARACATCFSGSDGNTGPALNGAIFFMLGMLVAVFGGIGAVAYGMYRRRHLAPINPPPPFATGSH